MRRYEKDVRSLLAFLTEKGMPTRAEAIAREHLEHFLADEQSRPRRRRRGQAQTIAPATVAGTYRSLQQLWRWLVDEGEAPVNPFDRMKPPHVPEQPVAVLADEQLRALLTACKGNEFTERRDTALIRLLVRHRNPLLGTPRTRSNRSGLRTRCGTGARQGRPGPGCPLRKPHRRGAAPLPATTSPTPPPRRGGAVDRYPRPLGQAGLRQLLNRRTTAAGIGHVHPHQFRHTMAHRRAGTRPDAPRRMALTANGRPLRRVRSR
jgi:integrase